jgi:hypothetical protein
MANEYVQLEELKATLEMSGQVFADEDCKAALLAASRGVDEACGRHFYAHSGAASARYFNPSSSSLIIIDDLYDFDTLETDQDGDGTFEQAWTENGDFVLEPLNGAADGWPFTRICLHPMASQGFPSYYPRSAKVTGKWGWIAVPGAIKEATSILAAKLLRRAREAPFGIVSVGIDVGATARIASSDPDVAFLIAPFIREKI